MEPGSVIKPDQGGQNPDPEQEPREPQNAQPPREEQPAPQAPQPEAPEDTPAPQNQPPVEEKPAPPEPSTAAKQPTDPLPPEPQPTDTNTRAEFTSSGFEQGNQQPPESTPPAPAPSSNAQVSWSASEYIAHQKGAAWYLGLAGAGALITVLVFVVTRDIIATAVFPVITLLFGIFAARPPEVRQYEVQSSGITISGKHYDFEDFKSFAVQEQASMPAIFLLPTKRFMPAITIYFPPDQGDEIIGTLSQYLPHEERDADAVDRLMHRVRF
ncbi:MAG: hypothetical protein U5L95_02040 [Candidatus Saccharibacteria bacterium]|nr:hypothetical protein [Candidatus Saccharibacteria bacterium]